MEDYKDFVKVGSRSRSVSHHQEELITGEVLERKNTMQELLNACKHLAGLVGQEDLDKNNVCVMATAGIGGSGKSTLLNLIRYGISETRWKPLVRKAIRRGCMRANPAVDIRRLVVIMATMNQTTTVMKGEQPRTALLSRLFADYTRSAWTPKHGRELPEDIDTLVGFAGWVRQQESTVKGCAVGEVAILILVDEIKKMCVLGPAATSTTLDELATFQHQQLADGLVSLVLVTSLDVTTFQSLTRNSQRPVRAISLPQLTDEEGLQKCQEKLEGDHLDLAVFDFTVKANIAFALSATGGHLRSVAAVMRHVDFTQPYRSQGRERNCKAVLTLLLELLRNPDATFHEDDEFGGTNIHVMASANMLMYTNTDFMSQMLQVRIIPAAMLNLKEVGGFERESRLLARLMKYITQTSALEKFWEFAIPMAMELRGRAFLRVGAQPTLQQVLPGVQIGFHENHKRLVLGDISEQDVCDRPTQVFDFTMLKKEQVNRVGCCIATNNNQKGIELSVTSFFARRNARPIPFFYQMKMWKSSSKATIDEWVAKARVVADKLCGDRASYYIVLCVSREMTDDPEEGVIHIDADACASLLEPFGASPLKRLIVEKAAAA